jgi:hypothetical protein
LVSIGLAALIVVVVCWLLLSDGDSATKKDSVANSAPSPASSLASGPAIVGAGDLGRLATSLGHPLYWLGDRPETKLELTHESSGDVLVRYLTGDAEAGDPRQTYVTVGTYPVPDAVAAVRIAAGEEGAEVQAVPAGGVAFAGSDNAYLAYPGGDYQIEVFAPTPGEAFDLIASGKVEPVG